VKFAPDLVVTAEGSSRLLLIVEAKLRPRDRSQEESQLKDYMLHMRCPIGLFVTPDEIVLYRDTYTAHSEESVRRVGSYPAPKKWMRFKVVNQGTEGPSVANIDLAQRFEEDVKFWLEQLRSSGSAENPLPDEAKDALEDYVIPALSQGVVRGGVLAKRRLNLARMRHVFVETNWVVGVCRPSSPQDSCRLRTP
jgi:hypothetical protein